MSKRIVLPVLLSVLFCLPAFAAGARLVPGTATELPQLVTSEGKTYKLGKKPYPAGTRAKWVAEGRALAKTPEGYLPQGKMLKGAADNRSYLPPIGDQDQLGSCVHWAGTYYTKTANMKRNDASINVNVASNQGSPQFTYNLTNAGEDSGGYGHEPFEIFMRYGTASLQQVPYENDYTTLPDTVDFIEGLHRRTTNYVWLWDWAPDAAQIAALKAWLDSGRVAACGVYAEESFDAWGSGDAPWVGSTCTLDDINHMVTVCGYGAGFYLVANQWGTSFGSNGYIVVDSDYFEDYFSDVMYPLEGTYEPATDYAKLTVRHGTRSDVRELLITANGGTVWSNSPLPKDMPAGDPTGAFATDSRDNLEIAVDLTQVPWGADNVVTARVRDAVSAMNGTVTVFTVKYDGTEYASPVVPVPVAYNAYTSAWVRLYQSTDTNVCFTSAGASVGEGSGTYVVTVYKTQASGDVGGQVVVSGTATEGAGADYTISGTNFTLNGATTSATFTVTLNDDADEELAETVILTLANVSGGIPQDPSVFTLTINPSDLTGGSVLISQYTETDSGSTPKGIEIWNASAADLTFDGGANLLNVKIGVNGAAATSLAVTVSSGTLAAGDVWVIGTSDMSPDIEETFTFNGDDSIVLELGGVVQDVIGDPGTGDPGAGWAGNGVQTYDQNIQLKLGTTFGDPDGWTDPSERFETVGAGSVLTGFGEPPGGWTDVAPVLAPIGNKSAVWSNDLSFSVSAADAVDGDSIVLSASNLPAGATFAIVTNAGTVSNTFVWNDVGPMGVYTSTFYAVDKDGMDSETITITVGDGSGPSYIAFQGFEGTANDTWGIADIDPALVLTTTGTADTPANQRVRTDANSWQPGEGEYTSETFELAEVDVSAYSEVVLTLHVSATTTEIGDGYGMYPTESLSLYLALDGGEFPATADMTVTGNELEAGGVSGALWGFDATGVAASTAGVARTVAPATGGVTDDGIATVQITLPPGTASVKLMGSVAQEYAGYFWNVDDISLAGINDGGATDYPPTIAVSPDGTEKSTMVSNELSFTISASEIPNDAGDEVRIWATGLPAGATFAGATNVGGASSAFSWTPTTAGTYPVSFYAGDKDGTNQMDVTITVYEGGGGTLGVFVGLNQYDTDYIGSDNWLDGCVPDALHIYTNTLKRGEWTPATVTLLTNSLGNKAAIRAAIASYAATAVAGDTFFYFHSSHGGQNSGTSVFLCAYDDNYEDVELAADLSAFATGVKVVVMVDACHSGGLFKSVQDGTRAERISKRGWDLAGIVSGIMDEQRAAKLAAGAKDVETRVSSSEIGWITAADYDQYSWDGGPNGGGVFTDKVIEGWTNNPPESCDLNADNYANFYELYDYSWDAANDSDHEYTTAMAHNTNVLLGTLAGWVGAEAPGGLIVFSNMTAQTMIVGDTLNWPVGAYTAGTNVPVTVTMTTVQAGASYADGMLTFTPATDGAYTFNFTGTNANGASATASLAVTATLPAPTLGAVTGIGNDRFTANWDAVAGAASYLLDVATADTFSAGSGGADLVSEGFATAAPAGWTMTGVGSYSSLPYVGTLLEGSLSIKFDGTGDSALTPTFAAGSATNLQFWAYGNLGSGSTFAISGLVDSVWTLLDTVSIAQNGATYNVALDPQTTQIGFYFTKNGYNCALDDVVVQASDAGSSTLILDGQSVAGTSFEVTGLDMDTTYYFRVRAVGNLTGPNSETGSATTTATDTAPSFDAIPGQSATVGVLLALDVSAYDSGYPAPVLSLVSSDAAGADYGFAGGTLSFTPSAEGNFEFVFMASNSLGTAQATANVAVAASPVYVPVASIVDLASTTFTVNWTPCTGATDYQMQVATDAVFAADSGGNLVENGGFETGDDTGWDTFEANHSVVTTDPQEGTYHVSCVASTTRKMNQAVDIVGDGATEYEVSFWYKKPGGGNCRIWSSWTTGGQVSGDNLQPTNYLQSVSDWTKVTYHVVPNSGANVLNFEVRTYTGATVSWDNFFVGVSGGTKAAPRAILVDETVSALTYPVTGLTPETLYYARVRMAGGTWSETVSATTLSSGPAAPAFAAIPAQNATEGVLFTLNVAPYVSGNPAPVLSLDSSTADAGDYSFAGGTLSFTPSASGDFEFTFRATNTLGTAGATVDVSVAEAGAELLAPVIRAASAIDAEQFNANWLASAGATGYRLDVATNELFRHTMGRRTATLAAGDLVIVTVNSDTNGTGKGFDAVPLVDLDAGTVIYFTDNGWSNGTWRANEGTVAYTAPGAITAGTVLSYRSATANGFVSNANFSLSTGGDTILAYQGSSNSPTFLYGIGWAMATPWVAASTNSNNSGIPAGLSAEAYTIVSCGSSDNYQYDAANGTTGSPGTLLQWVAAAGNWVGSDASPYAKFTPDFTVSEVEQYNDFVPGYENLDVGNVTTYAVTGLTEGVTYYYRAKAYNASSNSPYSAVTSVVTVASSEKPNITGFEVPAGATAEATLATTTLGETYKLQYTTDLMADPVVWTDADTEAGTGGEITLQDATPADDKRYYRVVQE